MTDRRGAPPLLRANARKHAAAATQRKRIGAVRSCDEPVWERLHVCMRLRPRATTWSKARAADTRLERVRRDGCRTHLGTTANSFLWGAYGVSCRARATGATPR